MFCQSPQAPQKDEKEISVESLDKKLKGMEDANDMYTEALSWIKVKHYANAFKCLEAALQKDKCHQKSLYTKGWLCEFATEEGNSTKALQTAISWYSVASTVVKNQDIAKAANESIARLVAELNKRESTEKIESTVKDAEFYYKEGIRLYNEDSKAMDAMDAFAQALQIDKYHARAQYALGFIYEHNVRDSLHDAMKWYTAAFGNGHKKAEVAIARINNQLNPFSEVEASAKLQIKKTM